MVKVDKQVLLSKYIASAITQGEATYEGDYKRGNKESKNLLKIYRIIEADRDLAEEMLNDLMINENVNVRIWASAHSLGLKIMVDKAERSLSEISQMPDIGILGFNAEMTLKVWKEKGEMKFY